MRIFPRTLIGSLGILLLSTALTQEVRASEAADTAVLESPTTLNLHFLNKSVEKRSLDVENATLLGFSQQLEDSTAENIRALVQTVLGIEFDKDAEARTKAAGSYTFPALPIDVMPHTGSAGELDKFNSFVVKGGLLLNPDFDQTQNDFELMKEGLARILNQRTQELEAAKKLKLARSPVKGADTEQLAHEDAQRRLQQEEERLLLAIYHLSVVRSYTQQSTTEAATLEKQDKIPAGDRFKIKRLRDSSGHLQEFLQALYDFERSKLMGVWSRWSEHSASQARRKETIGEDSGHEPFIIDEAYLTENPDFAKALSKLLYQSKAPQVVEALKERVHFGERPKPVAEEAAVVASAPVVAQESGGLGGLVGGLWSGVVNLVSGSKDTPKDGSAAPSPSADGTGAQKQSVEPPATRPGGQSEETKPEAVTTPPATGDASQQQQQQTS